VNYYEAGVMIPSFALQKLKVTPGVTIQRLRYAEKAFLLKPPFYVFTNLIFLSAENPLLCVY
jgi:hypothetical protein